MEFIRKLVYFCCFGTTRPQFDEDDDVPIIVTFANADVTTRPETVTRQPICATPHPNRKYRIYDDTIVTSDTSTPIIGEHVEILGIPLQDLQF